jgi:MerR family transcriptional regulator, light-induced transcriptional regulator
MELAMTRLNFEKSNTPKEQDWALDSQKTKRKFEFSTSPRLVGGTTFVKHAALDPTQVKLLADAAVQSMDETRKILTNWRRQGQTLADIYVYGIAQSARLIGELWSSDELDFTNGNIAFAHLHMAMLELSSEFLAEGKAEANGLSLLLMTEPGSQHGMGVFMLGEFFRRSGWRVTLATPQDIADFKRWFLSDWFDAVALSISTDRQIDHIEKALVDLNSNTVNPNLKIFVGGPMASILPDRLNWTGTVTLDSEAAETVDIVLETVRTATSPASGVRPNLFPLGC